MNLSKKTTMLILEKLIQDFKASKNEFSKLKLEAEIKCFQFHLKGFCK